MDFGDTVFLFDREKITEEQLVDRVKHYVKLAEKGLELCEKNKSEALEYLKEIRKTMKEEYRYYSRSKIQTLIWDNPIYNKYRAFITDAFVKQNSPNSYRTLASNLYDVMDYGRYYYGERLK